ncbi:MAG: hypothetical protein FWG98_15850 [Candidatus Cloacimonetes bacterium]|nr:hypothetical protein [Candidatus Cloacimonadota bacterium]
MFHILTDIKGFHVKTITVNSNFEIINKLRKIVDKDNINNYPKKKKRFCKKD